MLPGPSLTRSRTKPARAPERPGSVLMVLPLAELLERAARRAYRLDLWMRHGVAVAARTEARLCDEAAAVIRARAGEVAAYCTEALGMQTPVAFVKAYPLLVVKGLRMDQEIRE